MKYGDIIVALLRGRFFKKHAYPLLPYERDQIYWMDYVVQNIN